MTDYSNLRQQFPNTWKTILANNPELSLDAPARATGTSDIDNGTSQAKKSKYGNKRTCYNNRTYASKAEAERAQYLDLEEKAGLIFGLCYQVRFPLYAGVTFIADFMYSELVKGSLTTIVEDKKGVRTPEYKIKKKQFEAKYGIPIKET
jgi:hypothetical protein